MRSERTIGGRRCYLYGSGDADAILIQAVPPRGLEELDGEALLIAELSHGAPFLLAAFQIEDWNRELSPWEAPAVFGKEGFGAGAVDTLAYIGKALLPELERLRPAGRRQDIFLGGYSLSGLFALWAACQTERFRGIAAASPSVWFPGWDVYMESHIPLAPEVYLSLGSKEEKTQNRAMARVGDNIRRQYELLCEAETVRRCTLEWNPGNHFSDSGARTAKGFAWLLNGT